MASIRFKIEDDNGDAVSLVDVYATEDGNVWVTMNEETCEMKPIEARQLARLIEACAEAAES